MSYVIHEQSTGNLHEIKMNRMNSDAIQQLFDLSAKIFASSEQDDVYMLIDARESMLLPLRLLAHELRTLSRRDGKITACIAIVIANRSISAETTKMLETILERDRVQIFTGIEKARLWIDLEKKRRLS